VLTRSVTHAPRRRVSSSFWVGLCCAATAVLGVWRLGRLSLWQDEAFSADAAHRSVGSLVHLFWNAEANSVLYHVILGRWIAVAGLSETALRLPSVAFVVACVPMVHAIGRRLVGPKAALVGTALFAVNSTTISFAQEARGYALVLLLSLASMLAFLNHLESGRRIHLWLWVLASGALVYVHILAGVLIAVELGSLWFVPPSRRRRSEHLRGAAAILVLCVPLLAASAGRNNAKGLGLSQFGVWMLGSAATTILAAVRLRRVAIVVAALVLAAFTFAVPALRARTGDSAADPEQWRRRWSAALLLGWLAGPTLVLFAVSVAKPVLEGRYVIESMPAAMLFMAAGIGAVHHRLARRAAYAVLVATMLFGGLAWLVAGTREDWASAARTLAAEAHPGDGAVFVMPGWRIPTEYYASPTELAALTPLSPSEPWGRYHLEDHPYAALDQARFACLAAAAGRIWVVSGPSDPAIRRDYPVDAIVARSHHQTWSRHFSDNVSLELWEPTGAPVACSVPQG